jgi:hypothetical protein
MTIWWDGEEMKILRFGEEMKIRSFGETVKK